MPLMSVDGTVGGALDAPNLSKMLKFSWKTQRVINLVLQVLIRCSNQRESPGWWTKDVQSPRLEDACIHLDSRGIGTGMKGAQLRHAGT